MFGITIKKKKKILVVEDDALLAKALMANVEVEGFDALNVVNGTMVLDEAKRYQPNIILLDLMLPGIDGFEVLRQLKADDKTRNIPVFVISNLGSQSDIKSAKVLGAEEYFIKANSEIEKIIEKVKKKIS